MLFDEDMLDYLESVALEVLSTTYSESEEIKFPVDIRKIADNCGIYVMDTNINVKWNFFEFERTYGFLKKCGQNFKISVHHEDSELLKRYVIANEIAYVYLNKDEEYESHKFIHPFFYKNKMDLLCKFVASYILFPPKSLLKYFSEYENLNKDKNIYPIDSYNWLRSLGQKAQISTELTLTSFEIIRLNMYNYLKNNNIPEYEKYFKESTFKRTL